MDIRRRILLLGRSSLLRILVANLRTPPILQVVEWPEGEVAPVLRGPGVDVVVVDAAQATSEQLGALIAARAEPHPLTLSQDPVTYQLTVLTSLDPINSQAKTARVIGILAFALPPAGPGRKSPFEETP